MPSWQGNDVGAGCMTVDMATCAQRCQQNPSCNAFAYNYVLAGARAGPWALGWLMWVHAACMAGPAAT